MNAETAIKTLLTSTTLSDPLRQAAATELATHIKAGGKYRLSPYPVPQKDGTDAAARYPAVTYQRVSGHREHNMQGPSGYADPVIQIDSWAKTYKAAKRMGELVRQVLDGFAGVVGTNPDTIDINGILVVGEDDHYDENEQVQSCSLDFQVMHNE